MELEEFTEDRLFSGRLTVCQPRKGYRFSIEALLLAGFVRARSRDRILELGAGCGVVTVLLALRFPGVKIAALEIQKRLVQALKFTLAANKLGKRVLAIRGDLRKPPFLPERFDLVVANPPFKAPERGRLPPDRENLIARTEILARLEDFLKAARKLLVPKGKMVLVYPALRLADLLSEMRRQGLEPKRLRLVHSYPQDEGRFVLVEGLRGGKPEIRVEPPLFIYQEPGVYSEEVSRFFSAPEGGLRPSP